MPISSDWDESEDLDEWLWALQIWPLDINRAGFDLISALPGMNLVLADRIVANRTPGYRNPSDFQDRAKLSSSFASTIRKYLLFPASSPSSTFPVEANLRLRIDRRFGAAAADDARRYLGSPYGITQKYIVKRHQWSLGAILDKDKYEPRLDDLEHYYIAFRSPPRQVLAGDFHSSAGLGITIGKSARYFDHFPASALYRDISPTLTPATDTQVNRFQRGAAWREERDNFTMLLLAGMTQNDAIVSDSGCIERLSDGGLHRSSGEARKFNSLCERSLGGAVSYNALVRRWVKIELCVSGIFTQYRPAFSPTPSIKDPFPLTGAYISGRGFSVASECLSHKLLAEYGIDADGTPAWCAVWRWKCGLSHFSSRLLAFDFAADYQNPHAALPFGSGSRNLSGAGLQVQYEPQNQWLRKIDLLGEYTQTHTRTWTVPQPFREWKLSLNGELTAMRWGSGSMRLRQQSDAIGHGEAQPVETAQTSRLRYVHNWPKYNTLPLLLQTGMETGFQNSTIKGFSKGWLAFGRMKFCPFTSLENISLNLGGAVFVTPMALPFYITESDLPDRLATVRLSGEGWRWTMAALWKSAGGWFGFHLARNLRKKTNAEGLETIDKGDIEAYITVSYNFLHQP